MAVFETKSIRMIVTKDTFDLIVEKLNNTDGPTFYGLDTETTGLRWVDRLFSIQIATETECYYFNFNSALDAFGNRFDADHTLSREHLKVLKDTVFKNTSITWYIQNAIFDLVMLAKEGVKVAGPIQCTRAAGRTIYNEHLKYSLDAQAQRYFNETKDDGVMKCLQGHHRLTKEEQKHNTKIKNRIKTRIKNGELFTDLSAQLIKRFPLHKDTYIPGKKRKERKYFFHRVPKDVIVPYGCKDAVLVRKLGEAQRNELKDRPIWDVEKRIASICTDMVVEGIKVDRAYCEKAFGYEIANKEKAEKEFKDITGIAFKDGPKVLVEAFNKFNLQYPTTEKGNPSFTSDVLEPIDHDVARSILKIRQHEKMAGTYYSSFLYFADKDDLIHATPQPDGTVTGRFSYSDPNLQNVPKEDEEDGLEFYVRKCFVPKDDHIFFMVDFDQQEFRMMLDYSGQKDIIERVNAGEDVHEATATMVGTGRKEAKTLNYALLYGVGIAKLSRMLKIVENASRALKQKYFKTLPQIKVFINTCIRVAQERGYLRSWAGRLFFYPDANFAYKGPNSVIQGGCADVLKKAMIELHAFLSPYKSKILLQVHDELLFSIHKDELHLCPQIVQIMEGVYKPMNGLKLTCSASWSPISWGHCDKIKGLPNLVDIQKKAG